MTLPLFFLLLFYIDVAVVSVALLVWGIKALFDVTRALLRVSLRQGERHDDI